MENLKTRIPDKLDYALPYVMPQGSRAYDVQVQPDGQTVVVLNLILNGIKFGWFCRTSKFPQSKPTGGISQTMFGRQGH